MRYRVTHKTTYTYEEPVTLCHNEAHLMPRSFAGQRVTRHDLVVEPRPATIAGREDFFGNAVVYFALQTAHPELVVTAVTEVERETAAPAPSGLAWEDAVARTREGASAEGIDARQYVLESPMIAATPPIAAYARESFPPGRPLNLAVGDLVARIHRDFDYKPGVTTIATPVSEVFERRRGVCQDFAHLGIAALRAIGLAARYVSGYLETAPPPGEERLVGADASHAWLAVYDPDAGWIDFDPTNDQPVGDRYVTTAWGRDYGDVTPMKGIIFGGGAKHRATVAVDVERLENSA